MACPWRITVNVIIKEIGIFILFLFLKAERICSPTAYPVCDEVIKVIDLLPHVNIEALPPHG